MSKTDAFSKYSPTDHDKVMHAFIKDCYKGYKESCLSRAKALIKNNDFSSYKNLIKEAALKMVFHHGKSLEDIEFVTESLLTKQDLKLILSESLLKHKWWKARNTKTQNEIQSVIEKKPNLLCKTDEKLKDLRAALLSKWPKKSDFHELDFSDFPCGLSLGSSYSELTKDLKNLESKNTDHDYKFLFAKKKNAYYFYLKYKRSSGKKIWKALFSQSPRVQRRVSMNLFYNREYEKLGTLAVFNKAKIQKIHPKALEYVVKSLLYVEDPDGVEKVSSHINYKPEEWFEEIFFARGLSHMRAGKYAEAVKSFDTVLKEPVNLRLSLLYWKWAAYTNLEGFSKQAQAIRDLIIMDYPLTYYGLRLSYLKNGESYFDEFKKKGPHISEKISLSSSEIQKLMVYYSGDFKILFGLYFNSLKDKLSLNEKALFGMVLGNLGHHMLAMRVLNEVWDNGGEAFIAAPYIHTVFPLLYEKEVEKSLKKLNYLNSASVLALIRQESAFNSEAVSPSGAKGLMQVIEPTGREMARVLRLKSYKRNQTLFEPESNIKIGSKYLDRMTYSSKGYLPYALASYNAGPGNMYRWSRFRENLQNLREDFKKNPYTPISELWIEELPWAETRFYVKAVLRNLGIYKALQDQKLGCEFYWMCSGNNNNL